MPLTIQDLTELPTLQTRFLAGRSGRARAVLWAHTCELPQPWQWLGTGDLLMTDGYSFPAEPQRQVAFLQELSAANLSGLALADGMRAPDLTVEAIAEADALEFPVLQTAYSVPFVTLARAVADSNSHESGRRLHRVLRVYDLLRRSASGAPEHRASLLDSIAAEVRCDLAVLDVGSGVFPLPPVGLPNAVLDQVRAELNDRACHPLPAFTRVKVAEGTALVLPVREGSSTVLVALVRQATCTPDLVVLQHVVTIVSMEVERRAGVQLRRRVNGTRMMRQLLDATLDPGAARDRLAGQGLGNGPWAVLAVRAEQELDIEQQHAVWTQAGVPHVLLPTDTGVLVLVDDPDPGTLQRLADGIPGGHRMGVSRPLVTTARVPDAAREARWALEAAPQAVETVTRYGEQLPMFMPSTLSAGEAAVDQVLGGLLDYDGARASQLMQTLGVYLDENRSVQRCAAELGVHKQTVVYRLRRIEEVTGRRFNDVGDLASLYLAYRTWKLLEGHDAAT